MTIKTVTYISW